MVSSAPTPPETWQVVAVGALAGLTAILAIVDIFLMRTRYWFHFNMREKYTQLLAVPVLCAFLNVLMMFAKGWSYHFMMGDFALLARVFYLRASVSLRLELFNSSSASGVGSVAEAADSVGNMLAKSNHPPHDVGLCCVPCWCAKKIPTNSALTQSFVKRTDMAFGLAVLVLVLRQVFWDAELHHDQGVDLVLHGLTLVMVVLALGVDMALDKLMKPYIAPEKKGLMVLRTAQLQMFWAVIGGLNVIAGIIIMEVNEDSLWWVHNQYIFIAVELLVTAMLGHKAWVPPFMWGLGDPNDEEINISSYSTGSREKIVQHVKSGKANYLTVHDCEAADASAAAAKLGQTDAAAM